MHLLKHSILVTFILLLVGCSSYTTRYYFDSVGESHITEITKNTLFGRYNHVFENEVLEVYFDVNPNSIAFQMKNVSEEPFKIIWDSTSIKLEFEAVYKLAENFNSLEDDLINKKWIIKKDTLILAVQVKNDSSYIIDHDNGKLLVGAKEYKLINIPMENYSDDYIEMEWFFNDGMLSMKLLSQKRHQAVIDESKGTISFVANTHYKIKHINTSQLDIELPDSSDSKFSKINQIIELQKSESDYIQKPTIILPQMSVQDEIVFQNNKLGLLKFRTQGFIGTKIKLELLVQQNKQLKKYIFPYKVDDIEYLLN
jgi:hypothetical protein